MSMVRSLYLCLLLGVVTSLGALCVEPQISIDSNDPAIQAALKQVEALLSKAQSEGIPGLSAVVVYDQKILWANGFGYADLEERTPATAQTVYRVAGITKPFTATMLMQLRDAGKVHLDSRVTDYMSSYQVTGCPGAEPPTLLQLASHLAGLPHAPQVDFWSEESALTEIEVLKSLPDTEAILPPRKEAHYSHLGYVILGHALSLVAQQPYALYMQEHLFKPLGMDHTAFEPYPRILPLIATGYVMQEGRPAAAPTAATVRTWHGLEAAFGLMTSVTDMARFLSLQFAPHSKILKPSSVRQMQAPQYIFPHWRKAMAIGWYLYPQGDWTAVGHRGAAPGYSCEVRFIPELKIGVAVFSNLDESHRWMGITASDASPTSLAYQMLDQLTPTLSILRDRALQASANATASAKLTQYVGNYLPARDQSFFRPISITLHDHLLQLTISDATSQLTHVEGDQFRVDGKERITFVRDETGQVKCLRLNGGGFYFRKTS